MNCQLSKERPLLLYNQVVRLNRMTRSTNSNIEILATTNEHLLIHDWTWHNSITTNRKVGKVRKTETKETREIEEKQSRIDHGNNSVTIMPGECSLFKSPTIFLPFSCRTYIYARHISKDRGRMEREKERERRRRREKRGGGFHEPLAKII